MTWLPFDEALVEEISASMDLRRPNELALTAVTEAIEEGIGREVVCDLATGVGKTYLAAALVDYLARKGVRNVLFVTPGKTIYDKTIANFTPGDKKYVPGAEVEPMLITVENFARGQVGDALHDGTKLKLFVFNIQQLIRPTANTSRKTRDVDEFIGGGLYDHLRNADDLVIIADEHHVYNSNAKSFGAAIRDLNPRALVGLTATPDQADADKVIYRYSLAAAIADQLVKVPVIVYRQDGVKDETTQLADAVSLRAAKEPAWHAYADDRNVPRVAPVLFVVCQSIEDADVVAGKLAVMLPGDGEVLVITSQSSDAALQALANVEAADSSVRAIVSVNKLKEGWDVRNIAVIYALRALASETLTEQILGRGLRLPFGARTGIAAIDQVDLVAHQSYRELLSQKDALLERMTTGLTTSAASGAQTYEAAEIDGTIRVLPTLPSTGLAPGSIDILGGLSDADILIVSSFENAEAQFQLDAANIPQFLPSVPGKPHIVFPRRDRALEPIPFTLANISNAEARAAGQSYRTNEIVALRREALDATRDLEGNVNVATRAAGTSEGTQNVVTVQYVRDDLVRKVLGMGLVAAQLTERALAQELVEQFLAGAGVTELEQTDWATRRAEQAVRALADLVRAAWARTERRPSYVWAPQTLLQPRKKPAHTADRYSTFIVNEWYGGWTRNAESVAAFDSYSGEFAFAMRADVSEGVEWWLRIYTSDPAYINREPVGRYYPDFIVVDAEKVHWVVETKSDTAARNDTDVAAKRRDAEAWVIAVNDSKLFGTWRYLFVTESQLKDATDWESLLRRVKAREDAPAGG
jgi:type III restriction enzyme